MIMKIKIFPFLFIAVIIASWLMPAFFIINGFYPVYKKPLFDIASFLNASYQNAFEKYLTHKLPSLPNLLVMKNDIYEILNFGQYHSGYNGKIAQGKNGILFEKNYLICSWGYTTGKKLEKLAKETAGKLDILQNLLARRGIPLILAMAPSKVDFFSEHAPWQYTARELGPMIGSAIAGPIHEKFMKNRHVPFVDCYAPVASAGQGKEAFPDRGIHWTMYGAGVCLRALSQKLHELDPGKFPLLEIDGISKTSEARYGENDMAELMNIWPAYKRGRDYYYLADFKKISRSLNFVFQGDSFMLLLAANMELSGYSTHEMITLFDNRMPSREEFIQSLEHTDALILIGNATKFVQPYFREIAEKLISYLEADQTDPGKN